jgi:hypothetical protein
MEAPKKSLSMQPALEDLDLSHLWVAYPGILVHAFSVYRVINHLISLRSILLGYIFPEIAATI